MSSLLTHDEYVALSESLPLPTGAFIDGKARAAHDSKVFETVNPASGQVIAHIASCSRQDVDLAVEKARTVFQAGTWARLHEYSAKSNLKRIVLECGGKNPCIVLDDAEHLDSIAQHVAQAAFWNMGENCSANSRLIVHEGIKDQLVERILHRVREWPMGEPLDPANRLGSVVSEEQYKTVLACIKKARTEGARLILGGEPEGEQQGYFIPPTIFGDVKPAMTIAREEIFGPVLAIITVSSAEEAVAIANDTGYGLTASVFTASSRRAHRIARDVRAGTVTVNCFGEGDVTTPFGGFRQSGFGGRDKSLHALDQYTEIKTIWTDISDPGAGQSLD